MSPALIAKEYIRMIIPMTIPELDAEFLTKKFGPGQAVNMNSHAIVSRNERIYTIGLGGCNCTISRRGDLVQLAHYSPMDISRHICVLRNFRPDFTILWTLGEWKMTNNINREGNIGGSGEKWEMVPEWSYGNIGLRGLSNKVYCYSDRILTGENRIVNFNNGEVTSFCSNLEIL